MIKEQNHNIEKKTVIPAQAGIQIKKELGIG